MSKRNTLCSFVNGITRWHQMHTKDLYIHKQALSLSITSLTLDAKLQNNFPEPRRLSIPLPSLTREYLNNTGEKWYHIRARQNKRVAMHVATSSNIKKLKSSRDATSIPSDAQSVFHQENNTFTQESYVNTKLCGTKLIHYNRETSKYITEKDLSALSMVGYPSQVQLLASKYPRGSLVA